MKSVQRTLITVITATLFAALSAIPAHANNYALLRADMEQACPIVWEDLGIAISAAVPPGDVWQGDAVDRGAFVTQYAAANSVTTADADLVAGAIDAVSKVCATYRLALVDELMAKTTNDVSNAMTAAGGLLGVDYLDGSWLTGDVRVTGRAAAASGWVLLQGQTVGAAGSAATLAGSEYMALFELAKNWHPNGGSEDWANNDTVILPDMRGRSIYGADNMGGQSANVITDTMGDQLGGIFGQESLVMAQNQMPSHTHTQQMAGDHGHNMTSNGAHQHKLRTSVYTGSGAGRSDWSYFEGRARPNYQNTIQKPAVVSDGTHAHTITEAAAHAHVNDSTGGSTPIPTVSPGLVFNVEIKI